MIGALANRPVIIGGGLAGLLTALHLAPRPCVVLTTGTLGAHTSSGLAQGGIAAALDPADSPCAHAADTLAAGAGLSDPDITAQITSAGPDAIALLEALGAEFDRSADRTTDSTQGADTAPDPGRNSGHTPARPAGDRIALALEGAHSRPRVAHAGGDATGAELMRAAIHAVRRTPSITVLTHTRVLRVMTDDGEVGVVVVPDHGEPRQLRTSQVVLATGGVGGLFRHTTNPAGSRGQGLALAARAGATLRDLEMVQFHPTALDVGLDPMTLVTEAIRGAGARLVDGHHHDLVTDPLAGRDAVARAVWLHRHTIGSTYLDARAAPGPGFVDQFPTVAAACHAAGLDPAEDLIPVRPAAHYHMGGVAVDGRGRSTVPGLWAVGEVASTGLHGANRLASNSLLEAAVCARWVAQDLTGADQRPASPPTGQPSTAPDTDRSTASGVATSEAATAPATTAPAPAPAPATDGTSPSGWAAGSRRAAGPDALDLGQVRNLVSTAVGVLRDRVSLARAITRLQRAYHADPDDDAVLVALLLATSALRREESRGAHTRTDFPHAVEPAHSTLTLDDVLAKGPGLERSAR